MLRRGAVAARRHDPPRLVEDAVPQRLAPGMDRFYRHGRVQRLIIFGADDFVQVVGGTIGRRAGVLVYAGYVFVAAGGEVVSCARAEGAACSDDVSGRVLARDDE